MTNHQDKKTRRIALYCMLFLSCAGTLLFTKDLWNAFEQGAVNVVLPLLAPTAFAGFVVIYSIDRFVLFKREGFPFARACLQVAFALVFLVTLIQRQAREYNEAKEYRSSELAAAQLLQHPDANVRSVACELLGRRGDPAKLLAIRLLVEEDPIERVRKHCQNALEMLKPTIPPTSRQPASQPSPGEKSVP